MDIDVSKMAELLRTDAVATNPKLQESAEKYKSQSLFDEIAYFWTDLSHASDYKLEDYEKVLKSLPVYVEQMLKSEKNIGASIVTAPGIRRKRRLL